MMKQNEAIQDNIKGRKFVVLPNLMHNEKVRREKKFDVAIRNVSLLCSQELIKSRRILMIAGGCISGILGLQSTRVRSKNLSLSLSLFSESSFHASSISQGLFFFFAIQMIISVMQIFQMKFNIKDFLVVSVPNFFFRSAISEALTFVLFWALFYALVWIY